MNSKRPWIKRAGIGAIYIALTVVIVVCTTLFALLYTGEGAIPLLEKDLDKESIADVRGDATQFITPKPVTTPAPTEEPIIYSGRYIPFLSGTKWGYKNPLGQIVIDAQFDSAQEFCTSDVAFVSESGLFGLINRSGAYLIEPVWSAVRGFCSDRAAVERGGKWGYIDTLGNVIIDYRFREAYDFHCGRAAVREASNFCYIDVQGNTAITDKWREAGDFSENVAFATSAEYESDVHYIIDKIGEKIAKFGSHTSGTVFSEGFAVMKNGADYYFINSSAQTAFKTMFQDAKPFSGGLAAVKYEGLWGFINTSGVFVSQPQYSDVQSYSEGLAAVKDVGSGKWGYIDIRGNSVLGAVFDEAEPFIGGCAVTLVNGDYTIVTQSGDSVFLYSAQS